MNKRLILTVYRLIQLKSSAKKTEEQKILADENAIPVAQDNVYFNKQIILQMGVSPEMAFSARATEVFGY